jgi:formate dehydrogenase
LARVTGRPWIAFGPRWVERALVLYGRKLRWRDVLAHPHGWVYGEKEYGHFREMVCTTDGSVCVDPPEFVERTRRLLDEPTSEPAGADVLRLVNHRRPESMNSWLNDLPGLHRRRRDNDLEINPSDAARLGLATGDRARVSSGVASIELTVRVSGDVRPGAVCVEHGWGSRVFDPTGDGAPIVHGVNRNLLVTNTELDPLSQASPLNGTPVHVERISGTKDDAAAGATSEVHTARI